MSVLTLNISGYRSLKDVSWAPGALNILIGPNGSGKSNLLRALSLLQQAASGDLTDSILKQGGIAPLLWDNSATEIAWTLQTPPLQRNRDTSRQSLTYELRLRQIGKTSSFRIEHELLGNYFLQRSGQAKSPMKFLERDPRHAVTFDFEERSLAAHAGTVPDDTPLLSLVSAPFGNQIVVGFRERLVSWSIYHDVPIHQQAEIRQAAVARLQTRISSDGQNLIPVLHTLYTSNREFKKTLDSAMKAAFGLDFEELVFPPAADQRIQLRVRWKSLRSEQSASDLSDGTLRFLLLIAILASPSPGELIAIDEPESGLHPSMFPIVAELATEAAERAQVVMTTHSPQFLDAFSDKQPTTTVARWEGGQTVLTTIDGDELKRWLEKYTLGALFRTGELEGMA